MQVLLHATLGTTLLVFPALIAVVARRRRWRHVAALLATSVVISGIMAAVSLVIGLGELSPRECYSTDRWYMICLWGAYLTGWLVLAALLVRKLTRRIRNRSVSSES